MGQALFPITLEAMKSDVDDISLQGIEFWSNVSDEEIDLAIEVVEATEAGMSIFIKQWDCVILFIRFTNNLSTIPQVDHQPEHRDFMQRVRSNT